MLNIKNENLITAGEFARLSQPTKRTVHWYVEQGLLRPKKINSKGYRFYSIEQIIDFQVIMLLRKLNFTLPEIKKFLNKNASTQKLFLEKRQTLQKEVASLQKKIDDISTHYINLNSLGVLVKPTIKTLNAFNSFFIEKTGAYAQIPSYLVELKSCFSSIPNNAIYFVLFPDREYSPKKDRMKIGVVATDDMKLKDEAKKLVIEEIIPSFKSLHYQHIGSPVLISMIIMQMHTYMGKNKIKQNLSIPINELEFYTLSVMNGHRDENTMISEINIPII